MQVVDSSVDRLCQGSNLHKIASVARWRPVEHKRAAPANVLCSELVSARKDATEIEGSTAITIVQLFGFSFGHA